MNKPVNNMLVNIACAAGAVLVLVIVAGSFWMSNL